MTTDLHFQFKAIGHVTSCCYPDKFGTPRQPGLAPSSRAFIQLLPETQPELSLDGLAEYSHLWVIFIFHKNTSERFHAKIHPPRLEGKTMGLFATRTPHRPNPIGLSLVQIESLTAKGLWVSGLDLVEGTPILDIKPYLPEVESRPQARSGWTAHLASAPIEVLWRDEHLKYIDNYETQTGETEIQKLVEETLSLDPRPTVYRGHEGSSSPYRDIHIIRIYNLDFHFKFESPRQIQILKIQPYGKS